MNKNKKFLDSHMSNLFFFVRVDLEPEAMMRRATLFESYDMHLPTALIKASQSSQSASSSSSVEGQ